jgi:hypothetical protein
MTTKLSYPGVGGVANAVLQAALARQRRAEDMAARDDSVEFNARMQQLIAMRSAQMRQNLQHTRQPIILHAGHPPDSGRGDLPLLEGDHVPPGFDEGMVRMASDFGAEMARTAMAKEADFMGSLRRGLGSAGTAIQQGAKNLAGRVGGAISNRSWKPSVPKPTVAAGVGTSPSAINTIKNNGSMPGSGNFKTYEPAKPPPTTVRTGPAPVVPDSHVTPKGQPKAPSQEATFKTWQPQQSTWGSNPLDKPAPKAAPKVAPPAAPAAPPTPTAPAPPPSPTTGPVPMAESAANGPPKSGKGFLERAQQDLGNGKWKPKLLGLGMVAAGTYGAYRGAQALARWGAKAPHEHEGNEGGVIPPAAVNQYGVPDRNIT